MRAESASGNSHQHRLVEIGGIVDGILEVVDLDRRDEGAGARRREVVPRQAHAQRLALGGDHRLVERRSPAGEILRRVHGGPLRAVDDLVENRRRASSVEPPVEVDRLHQVPGASDHGEAVAEFSGIGVWEESEGLQSGQDVGPLQRRRVAG